MAAHTQAMAKSMPGVLSDSISHVQAGAGRGRKTGSEKTTEHGGRADGRRGNSEDGRCDSGESYSIRIRWARGMAAGTTTRACLDQPVVLNYSDNGDRTIGCSEVIAVVATLSFAQYPPFLWYIHRIMLFEST